MNPVLSMPIVLIAAYSFAKIELDSYSPSLSSSLHCSLYIHFDTIRHRASSHQLLLYADKAQPNLGTHSCCSRYVFMPTTTFPPPAIKVPYRQLQALATSLGLGPFMYQVEEVGFVMTLAIWLANKPAMLSPP